MKELLLNMADKFTELKRTRLDMLKSLMFRATAQQLEPVEQLAGYQHDFNLAVEREIEALKQKIENIQGGDHHANS